MKSTMKKMYLNISYYVGFPVMSFIYIFASGFMELQNGNKTAFVVTTFILLMFWVGGLKKMMEINDKLNYYEGVQK